MTNNRRSFLKTGSIFAGAALFNSPLNTLAAVSKKLRTIENSQNCVAIFHTNDLHGKVETSYFDNLPDSGGLISIKNFINEQPVSGLLLNSGNFLSEDDSFENDKQVINVMNKAGYHTIAIGNNDLLKGQDYLAALASQADFTFVNCNYKFSSITLAEKVKPYCILRYGKYKVGITGIGAPLKNASEQIIRYDPVQKANQTAKYLKETEACDLVICLSDSDHSEKFHIKTLATHSENIDLIIGGQYKKILNGPLVLRNRIKNEVIVSHAAWNGLMVGAVNFSFNTAAEKNGITAKLSVPGVKDPGIKNALCKLLNKEQANSSC